MFDNSCNFLFTLFLSHKRTDKATAFHMACEQGSMPMVEYLVSKDPAVCRITLVDFKGKTPLHLAASKNHTHIVELLLENVSVVKYQARKRNQKYRSFTKMAKNDIRSPLIWYSLF